MRNYLFLLVVILSSSAFAATIPGNTVNPEVIHNCQTDASMDSEEANACSSCVEETLSNITTGDACNSETTTLIDLATVVPDQIRNANMRHAHEDLVTCKYLTTHACIYHSFPQDIRVEWEDGKIYVVVDHIWHQLGVMYGNLRKTKLEHTVQSSN